MFKLNWEVGDKISIGWPDHGRAPQAFELVEVQIKGPVFRGRVTDGQKEGGFLIITGCPDVVLEQIAEEASAKIGFKVIASSLRCFVDSEIFRSLDYEWYPTPEYAERPKELTCVVSEIVSRIFPNETN
tara:strand:+ start:50 stop:436 length:387 start_codon:yes stop_codon:yes gene_type:complete